MLPAFSTSSSRSTLSSPWRLAVGAFGLAPRLEERQSVRSNLRCSLAPASVVLAERMKCMRLQFLGSGDAFGSGGRFNTCILVENEAGAFFIDCGASSLIAMRKYGIDPNCIDTVFISHLHGDHFGGLPFLILDAQFYSRRTTPLTLVGPTWL
jgi:predicted metal-dependent RNase